MGLNHDGLFRPPAIGFDQAPRFPLTGPYLKYDTRNLQGLTYQERFAGDGFPTTIATTGSLANEGSAGSTFDLDALAESVLGSGSPSIFYDLEISVPTFAPPANLDTLLGGPPSAAPYCWVVAISDLWDDPYWALSGTPYGVGLQAHFESELPADGSWAGVYLSEQIFSNDLGAPQYHGMVSFSFAEFGYATTGDFADQLSAYSDVSLDSSQRDSELFTNMLHVFLLDPCNGLSDQLVHGTWCADDPRYGYQPSEVIGSGDEWWGTGDYVGTNPAGYLDGRRARYRDTDALPGGEYLPGYAFDAIRGAPTSFRVAFDNARFFGGVPDPANGHPHFRGFALYRGVPTLAQLASIAADFGCTLEGGSNVVKVTP